MTFPSHPLFYPFSIFSPLTLGRWKSGSIKNGVGIEKSEDRKFLVFSHGVWLGEWKSVGIEYIVCINLLLYPYYM